MSGFPVRSLRSVDFVVPDLGAACEFYSSVWGLIIEDRSNATAWMRGSGEDPHILALHEGDHAAIKSMTFRASPEVDLEELRRSLSRAGAQVESGVASLDEPGCGSTLVARDPFGRTIRVVQNDVLRPSDPLLPDVPERLSHVNINSRQVDQDALFFIDGLGFSLTDRSKMMSFVRTNSDHHTVVVAEAPVNTLNHVAFQLPGWEDVMRASGRMVDSGFAIGWGPGRHGPGDNVFAYFVDPFGFVIEYTAEVLQVDDSYAVGGPEDWVWPPGRSDQWGICPPKTSECKAAQLAIPFE